MNIALHKVMLGHHAKGALYAPYNWGHKKITCKKLQPVNHLTTFCGFCILLTTEVVDLFFYHCRYPEEVTPVPDALGS